MRRVTAVLLLAGLAGAAGCAGGEPQPGQVKSAARSWATSRLHPHELSVTLVVVAPDERRARVRLKADGRRYDVRLGKAGGAWKVTSATS